MIGMRFKRFSFILACTIPITFLCRCDSDSPTNAPSDSRNTPSVFSMKTIPLTFVSPQANKTYLIGTELLIKWTIDSATQAQSLIPEISFDGGKKYWDLSYDSYGPQSGEFTWTIPSTIGAGTSQISTISDSVIVRFRDYSLNDLYAYMGFFRISK